MESKTYEGIQQMLEHGKLDEILSDTEKGLWRKRIKQFTLRQDFGLMWNGYKVPAYQQVENVLHPIHYQGGRHVRTMKVLRKASADCGLAMPAFMGELERRCTL